MNVTANKKTIMYEAITAKKANAQSLTCFIAFITATALAIVLMLVACIVPAMIANVTEVTCWASMVLEATSIALGYVAYWIKKNAL